VTGTATPRLATAAPATAAPTTAAPAAATPDTATAAPTSTEPPILAARRRDLERLAAERWDLLVVGGGITGCGILLDATSRGLKAALVERDDYAVGTSGRSSRLIHGGLRYLEQFHVGLVREALAERGRLLQLAPHLVRIEPFLFPIYGGPLTRPFFDAGLTMYDLLGASADGGRHRHLSVNEALEATPVLRRARLRGAFVYHDGQEDDARYTLAVARTAVARGALAVTRVSALAALEEGGRIAGATVRDERSGAIFPVRADRVIDATGVWSGRTDGPFPVRDGGTAVRPSRGTHIVVRRDRIPSRDGLTLRIPGRVCFLVPWPDRWVIGTTDLDDDGPPDRPVPSAAEIDNILGNVNATLDIDLGRNDLMGAYTGLRPLATDPGGHPGSTVKASREHRIRTDPNGLVRIGGGKYTTYRLMAAQTVDAALGPEATKAQPSATAELPIVGAALLDELGRLAARLTAETGLDRPRAERLVARHGTEASDVVALGRELDLLRPLGPEIAHLEVEVVRAVRSESALSLDDVLARRTRLAQELPDRGASIAPRVAELIGGELGWSAGERSTAIEAYLASAHREYDVPDTDPTPARVASAAPQSVVPSPGAEAEAGAPVVTTG
jgi:glycerol-3-phosphate dehydrogenase